jgi:hypothetical protein
MSTLYSWSDQRDNIFTSKPHRFNNEQNANFLILSYESKTK